MEENDPWLSLPAAGKGHSYSRPKRAGERKHRFVQGCSVDANLSVLNLAIAEKGGQKGIPGQLIHPSLVT